MRKYLMEAIGSFVLVIIVGLTNDAIAIGTIIAAMIAGGMQISGAHFNPAISFAFYLRKKLTLSTLIGYTVSQILGAFAAAGVLLMLAGSVFYVEPPISTNLYQQATVEIILTFILVFAFLSLISMRGGKSSRINAIGIGLTYIGLIIVGENISGAVFNPALSIGTSMVDFLAVRGSSIDYVPLFTLAPLTGAALASLFYRYLHD